MSASAIVQVTLSSSFPPPSSCRGQDGSKSSLYISIALAGQGASSRQSLQCQRQPHQCYFREADSNAIVVVITSENATDNSTIFLCYANIDSLQAAAAGGHALAETDFKGCRDQFAEAEHKPQPHTRATTAVLEKARLTTFAKQLLPTASMLSTYESAVGWRTWSACAILNGDDGLPADQISISLARYASNAKRFAPNEVRHRLKRTARRCF